MALIRTCRPAARRGAAARELALLLLLLPFMVVFAIEFARMYYFSVMPPHSARQRAPSESNPSSKGKSPDKPLREAARADAPNADNPTEKLTVESTTEANRPAASTWRSRSASGSAPSPASPGFQTGTTPAGR
jgi:hypothetical protein